MRSEGALVQRLSQQPANYVGLQNYDDLFTGQLNNRFRVDVVNTIFFTGMFILVCLTVGLLLHAPSAGRAGASCSSKTPPAPQPRLTV